MSECVICTENLQGEIAALMCGHLFHLKCIKQWFQQKPQCPCCKQSPSQAAAHRADKRFIKIFLNMGTSENLTPVKRILESCDENDPEAKLAVLTRDALDLRREKQELQVIVEDHKTRITSIETENADMHVKLQEVTKYAREESKQRQRLWSESHKAQKELSQCRRELQELHSSLAQKDKELSSFKIQYVSERCIEHLEQGNDLDDFEELQRYNSEERCAELKKIMRWREKQHRKTQSDTQEMQKELQSLRTKARISKSVEQDLQKQMSELKRKYGRMKKELEYMRECTAEQVAGSREDHDGSERTKVGLLSGVAAAVQHGANTVEKRAESTSSAAFAGGKGKAGASAVRQEALGTQSDLEVAMELHHALNGGAVTSGEPARGGQRKVGDAGSGQPTLGSGKEHKTTEVAVASAQRGARGGGSEGAKEDSKAVRKGPLQFGRRPTQSRAGSLLSRDAASNPSNDPDDPDRGGRYIRTGPDGMGGAINVLLQPAESRLNAAPRYPLGGGGSLAKRGAEGCGAGNRAAKKAKAAGTSSITAFFSAA